MPDLQITPEQVAAVMRILAGPPSQVREQQMPCEVTVCMCVYNAFRTLGDSLESIKWGEQSVPFSVILTENGSRDGTHLILKDLMQPSVTLTYWTDYYQFRDLRVIHVPHNEEYPAAGLGQQVFNCRESFRAMFDMVTTPYVMTLDADVEVPRGGARTMLEVLRNSPDIGMVGIQYDPTDACHVKHGLAMLRVEDARDLAARTEIKQGPHPATYKCICSQWTEMIRSSGRKAVNLSPLSARHKKLEV